MRYIEPLRNQAAPAGPPRVRGSQSLLGDDAARAEQIVTSSITNVDPLHSVKARGNALVGFGIG